MQNEGDHQVSRHSFLKKLDIRYVISYLQNNSELANLLKQTVGCIPKYGLPQFVFENFAKIEKIELRLPPISELMHLEGIYGAYYTFINIPYMDFLYILSCLLQEYHILFFSKNQSLLTFSM